MTDRRWYRDIYRDAVGEDETLTAVEKAVAETYARHARDKEGAKTRDADRAWLTYPRLMAKAGIGRREKVQTTVEALEKAGWLTVVERVSRRATVYRLTIPAGSSAPGTTDDRNYGDSDGGTTEPSGPERPSPDAGTTVVPVPDHGSSAFGSGSSDAGTQPLGPLKEQPSTTSSSYEPNPPAPTPASVQEEGRSEDLHKKTADRIANRYRQKITFVEARKLAKPVAAALQRGWTEAAIVAELDRPTAGLASVAAGLIGRARDLGDPPAPEPAKRSALSRSDHRKLTRFRPNCPHGEAGGNIQHPDDGWVTCAQCRHETGWAPDNGLGKFQNTEPIDLPRRPDSDYQQAWQTHNHLEDTA